MYFITEEKLYSRTATIRCVTYYCYRIIYNIISESKFNIHALFCVIKELRGKVGGEHVIDIIGTSKFYTVFLEWKMREVFYIFTVVFSDNQSVIADYQLVTELNATPLEMWASTHSFNYQMRSAVKMRE